MFRVHFKMHKMLEFKIWKFDRLIENISPHFGAQKNELRNVGGTFLFQNILETLLIAD